MEDCELCRKKESSLMTLQEAPRTVLEKKNACATSA